MAVQDRARRIGDRVVAVVVAFGEHGVERGDRTLAVGIVAGALDQRRHHREHRRRVALGRRRLADRQRDLALRLRVAGQRIHQQQHALAAVAEPLGDRGGVLRAAQALERRRVRRRGDDHRTAATFLAQRVLDELLHFAAAFPDQPHHHHVGVGVFGHHAQQGGLAHAGAGEQAQALAAADGEQRVDRAHAGVQRSVDRLARHRVDRLGLERGLFAAVQRAGAVQRQAVGADHAAEQARAHRQAATARARAHPRIRQHAMHVADRHQQQALVGEADHLGIERGAVGGVDQAARTQRGLATFGLQGEADHPAQAALDHQRARGFGLSAPARQLLLPRLAACGDGGFRRHGGESEE